jgi:hypothetical protein
MFFFGSRKKKSSGQSTKVTRQALVVGLDSVAPGRLAPQRLVKELSGRPHPATS